MALLSNILLDHKPKERQGCLCILDLPYINGVVLCYTNRPDTGASTMRYCAIFVALVATYTPVIAQDLQLSASVEGFTNLDSHIGAIETRGDVGVLAWHGFIEASQDTAGTSWIAPLEARLQPLTNVPLELVARGGTGSRGEFLGLGGRWNIIQTPVVGLIIGRALVALSATYLRTVDGQPYDDEVSRALPGRSSRSVGWGR